MLLIGDVHVYVCDFTSALRFYEDGLGLTLIEKEVGRATAFALLESADGGPALRLFGGATAWPDGTRPDVGTRPTVRFDVVTSEFDTTIVRAIEHGGRQVGEIEEYDGSRVVTLADPDGNTFELLETRDEDRQPESG